MFIPLVSIFHRPAYKRIDRLGKQVTRKSHLHEANERAIVTKTVKGLEEAGRVHFRATWWPALCSQNTFTLKPGQRCRVVSRNNITLIVEPVDS